MTTQSGDLRTECVRDAINRRLDRVARIVIPCYLPSRTDFPVLIHELRIRQRGIKPFAILFVYTTVLSIIALTTLSVSTQNSAYTPPQTQTISAQNPARQGRTLFTVLSMAQLAMIALIVPAYSSGIVTAERERGTFDLLAITVLSSSAIVGQKMVAAIAQAIMLTVASLPIVALVFMLGGVSPIEVGIAYLLLFLSSTAFGALGLMCSCQFRNTRTATFVTYLSVLGFLVGIPILGELLRELTYMSVLDMSFAPVFLLLFAFVVGALSMPLYLTAAIVFSKWSSHWRSRVFRMWTFAGAFALVALVLESPPIAEPLINGLLYHNDSVFLPTLVNPFMAMTLLLNSAGQTALQHWAIGGTIIFAVAATYLFRHISTLRFEAMRRI